jgi:hypothetical protein
LLFAVFAFAFRVLCAGSTLAGHDDFRSLLAVLATGWDGKAQQLFGWLVLYGLISYELGVHRHLPPFFSFHTSRLSFIFFYLLLVGSTVDR